jgi:signal peptide peptidase SppA
VSEQLTVRDQAILQHLCHEHWAIQDTVMDRLLDVVGRHADGIKLPAAEIVKAIGGEKPSRKPEDEYAVVGETAIIGVSGILAKHASMVNGVSQPTGSSVQRVRADLDRAMADGRVRNILLRLESPGGMVAGISDLGEAILAARATKRVVAFADDVAASGAYWLASQADEVYANAAAAVGSIGVVSVLVDESAAASKDGTRFHVVRAGARKGNAGAPVPYSEADIEEVQNRVNAIHQIFIEAVARGRGVDADAIRPVADGRVLTGQQAVDGGLVDAVATLDAVMAMLAAREETPKSSALGKPDGPAGRGTRMRKSTTVAAGDKESEMSKETTSPPTGSEAAVDKVDEKAIRLAAAKDANEAAAQRVRDLTAALGGRTELLTACIAEGLDVTAAKARLADALAAENKTLGEQLVASQAETAEARKELESLKGLAAKAGIKPLAIGGKDEQAEGDGGYEAMVAERIAAGAKEHRARIEASKKHPEAHAAWLKGQQARK